VGINYFQVFKDGHIIQEGKYEDILEAGTDLSALIAAHHDAMESMDVGTSDSSENSSESASISEDHSIEEENNDDNISISSMRDRTLTSRNSSVDHMAEEISITEEKRLKKEKKKVIKAQMKQLVQDEERLRGKISFKVYLSYIAAAYRGLLIPLIILAQTAFQV
jgi:hypothetical protein